MPGLTKLRHATPGLAVTQIIKVSLPCLAWPDPAIPGLATPYLARPGRNYVAQSHKLSLPCRAQPNPAMQTRPDRAQPRPTKPCHAKTGIIKVSLPCRTLPRLSTPRLTQPDPA